MLSSFTESEAEGWLGTRKLGQTLRRRPCILDEVRAVVETQFTHTVP